MFFDDLMKELTALDLQDDVTLLEWLHRLFAHAEKLEVTQLPNREKIADKICDARGIPCDINPVFPPPGAAQGSDIYATHLLREAVFTLRQNPGRSSPLHKHYGTARILIELYLERRPK